MANCPRCGTATDGPAPGGGALCEACKWASMSHQPIANLGLSPTPGYVEKPDPTASRPGGPRPTGVLSPPRAPSAATAAAGASMRRDNLPIALLMALAAGVLCGGVWYGLAVATDFLWFSVLIGVAVGFAASYGNGGRSSAPVFGISVVVTLVTQLVALYLVLRHAIIADGGADVPLVMTWEQTGTMFREVPETAWWITLLWGAAGAVLAWRRNAA